jgi:hypothetical protein
MAYTNDDRLVVASQAETGALIVGTFTSTVALQIVPADSTRVMLTIYNEGPGILYVLYGEGTPSATNYSVKMYTDDYLELPFYQGQVKGLFASTGTARITDL